MKNSALFILLGFFMHIGSWAQSSTDIVLFDIKNIDGKLSLENPTWVTKRKGYDNQPHFSPDGNYLYYTSIRENEQADIYRYNLNSNEEERFTVTDQTSEYSPTVMPNGKFISVIMVEEDGQTQRLWKFPIKGGKPKIIMDQIQPVGYHSWMNKKELMMFILGSPPTLQAAHIKKQQPKVIADKIGRSIHRIPSTDAVSFVIKESEKDWKIYQYDTQTNTQEVLVECLEGSEDYCWLNNKYVLMGKGETLYGAQIGENGSWELVDELNLGAISRLAVNQTQTKIALVIATN